ncbi:hypothetical protein T12_10495 [Trichinella patagoniensis]|uniref:Uncharacterized protein n=1 Tax=Trichinella patagoniensis TaxID=990121 RepID=A0A0V0ZSI3_9BILA|nr:hypothetical protein T12_10495 [Trichinella patagoniensis]
MKCFKDAVTNKRKSGTNYLQKIPLFNYPEQRSIFALGDESMRIEYEEQMSEAHFKRNTVLKKMNLNGFHT